jgi:hypothetical protein
MSKQSDKSNVARQAPAQVSGRLSVGALLISSVFSGALLAAAPAHAFGPGDREPPRREERDNRERERDTRAFERAEERRRAMQEAGNADMSRRVDRMTPDERRDLRRQINEAGQEIYVRPQRR